MDTNETDLNENEAAEPVQDSEPKKNPLSDPPEDKSEAKLVEELTEWFKCERDFWSPVFDRMRQEQKFAAGAQWPGYSLPEDDKERERYVGDVIQQLVNRKTASLYAKNPTPDAKRLEKMFYEVWDESEESLRGAREIMHQSAALLQQASMAKDFLDSVFGGPMSEQQGMMVLSPDIQAQIEQAQIAINSVPPEVISAQKIVNDFERGHQEKALLDKLAKTARILLKHQWKTHKPDFLACMKHQVSQAIVARVGYVKVQYRRETQSPPSEVALQADMSDKLAVLKQKVAQATAPDADKDAAVIEDVRLMMQSMASGQERAKVTTEGMVYDFLSPTSIIIDRRCRCLKEFLGAHRVAHQMFMSIEDAERQFSSPENPIRLRDAGAVLYAESGDQYEVNEGAGEKGDENKLKVCVFEIYDKDAQLCYWLCDGVKQFLKPPYEPQPALERFWNVFPVVLNAQVIEINDPKNDVTIYPRSDVRLAMPMQMDINAAGEGLREHRVANRPWWIGVKSKFEENDQRAMGSPRAAHDVLWLRDLVPGEKISDYIQPGPTVPIDPRLYDTNPNMQAMLLATGMQSANLGGQQPDEKATGQAIAEGARITADQSNVDDIDYVLSGIAQASWEILIQEMPVEVVKQIVGRGAVWPQLSRQQVQAEIFLEVEAGSSGRPNKALEVQNARELGPIILQALQAEGLSQWPAIKEFIRRLDDKADVNDWKEPSPIQQQVQMAGAPPLQIEGENSNPQQPAPGANAPGVLQPGQVAPEVRNMMNPQTN